jgi:hypothetical protein
MTGLREAAGQVAAGVAALSRLSRGADDELRDPADVRDVVSGLAAALSGMPEVLTQLAVFLEVEKVRGGVVGTDGGDAGATVRAVSDALHRASLDAEAMAAALEAALACCQQVTAHKPAPGPARVE